MVGSPFASFVEKRQQDAGATVLLTSCTGIALVDREFETNLRAMLAEDRI
jgi:hypothetical protein